ncbi:hypothetical protein EAX62_04620 [Tessaracoccus antarcticus]|uniref:Glycosyltransferase family 4 protein n=2 Tax=Tessaracoccus antarcticus TaxID=2479848 RepID=A0A3M0GC03_9ACTN|nr:hypothetical protein EAX62_04620 [Tessaracoccus antarcticus]
MGERDGVAFVLLIVTASCLVGVVGLVEDVRGLRVSVRLALQLLLGVGVGLVLVPTAGSHWIIVPLSALGFAAYVNFANFMDGINGISSLHGLTAGLAFSAMGGILGYSWLMLAGLLVAVAFFVFLPWNIRPPGMFLGDVGSYLLGGSLSAIAIVAIAVGVHPVAAFSPLCIYLADTLATLVRRALKGESLHHAHRTHFYQRLSGAGLSHLAVAAVVSFLTALTGGIGLLLVGGALSPYASSALLIAVIAVYLFLPGLRQGSGQRTGRVNVSAK